MAQRDRYDNDILKVLQRIATSLDKIEKKIPDNVMTPNELREKMGIALVEEPPSKVVDKLCEIGNQNPLTAEEIRKLLGL